MSASSGVTIRPKKKALKILIARVFLFVLGRAFQAASFLNSEIKRTLASWPEGYTVMMKVNPRGPCMVLAKEGGRMRYKGEREVDADLAIRFRHLESALLVLTAQIGTPQSFAENRATLKGDLSEALRFIRCLTILQAHLFPPPISKRLLKRVPPTTVKQVLDTAVIYVLGVPLGRP